VAKEEEAEARKNMPPEEEPESPAKLDLDCQP